ncbi:MAG: RsmD family RNA methyltransferase [Bacteroidota bacterium]
MRIIAGKYRGRVWHPPKGLPVRPTTDRTKESLFNILNNWYDWEGLRVLELFAGTGNISLEFWSRGVAEVISVDQHHRCVKAIETVRKDFGISGGKVIRMDAAAYVRQYQGEAFDIVFMDPPYAMPRQRELVMNILAGPLLHEKSTLIVEHASQIKLDDLPGFDQQKTYGSSRISFFDKPPTS